MSLNKSQLDVFQEHIESLMLDSFTDGFSQGYNLANKSLAENFIIPMLESESEETFAEIAQKMCQVILREAENAAKASEMKIHKVKKGDK